MSETNKPKKPLCIRRADAFGELVAAVNHIAQKHELSFSVIDDLLFRITVDVSRGAENELAQARKNYTALINEYEKHDEEAVENG